MLISAFRSSPNLPLELILQIIDTLAPTPPIPIALPPFHHTTKTLISLTATSRTVRPAAVRLLYKHCLYIDCERPLFRLLLALGLCSDNDVNKESEDMLGELAVKRILEPLLFRPKRLFIKTEEEEDEHLWIKPIIDDMGMLLEYLRPTLTHLVVDLPLRTLGKRSQKLLRKSIENLPNLELVCDLQDSFNTSTMILPPLPKVRHLMLYNPDVCTGGFLPALRQIPYLETLVLILPHRLEEVDLEGRWASMMEEDHSDQQVNDLDLSRGERRKKLLVFIVNLEEDHRRGVPGSKVGKWMDVRQIDVPKSHGGYEDFIDLCRVWVKRRVLSGEEPAFWEM